MLKGFNSDLNVRGKMYHVQSEDWGSTNPYLVSRVFLNGAVVKTIKTPHDEALRGGPVQDAVALGLALRKQHQRVIEQIHAATIL